MPRKYKRRKAGRPAKTGLAVTAESLDAAAKLFMLLNDDDLINQSELRRWFCDRVGLDYTLLAARVPKVKPPLRRAHGGGPADDTTILGGSEMQPDTDSEGQEIPATEPAPEEPAPEEPAEKPETEQPAEPVPA